MLDAAAKALSQMLSPPLRAVLLKAVALAIALIIVIGFALERLLVWLLGSGMGSIEDHVGNFAHVPLEILAWLISIAAGFGIILGGVFLMPAVTAFVASFFVDQIAEEVERTYYPADAPGFALPLGRAVIEGGRTAILAIVVYLCALPLLLLAVGAMIFFFATAWLLGREYFELAAMRFHPPAEAKRLRKLNATTVFIAGLFIAAFVSIPLVNLATPLFGMAFMVHMHKRLVGAKPRLMDAGAQ